MAGRNANEDVVMSLGDHLEELRARVLLALVGLAIGVCVALGFGQWIIRFIELPYEQVRAHHKELAALAYLAPADAFIAYTKVAIIAGLILSSPWVFYQLWMFVAAGLYPHERRYVYIAVPFCATLFVLGALFFLFVIARITLEFFVTFGNFIGVVPMWMLDRYISFMTMMMLVFGLAFQTPAVVFVLYKIGIVSIQTLRSIRKYAVFGAVVVGGVATPSVDVVSQIALAVPLYLLYELGIVLCVLSDRKKKASDDVTPAPTDRG
jgi:sec-independent protein translocase protein TatC